MTLLRNGIDLADKLIEFINLSENIFIFVPYIKLPSLKLLLDSTRRCSLIVVRWEPRDFITGSSDLEVFDFCKERKIALYRNPQLHLKAFIDNYHSCIIGSANISSRALNLPESKMLNYELATNVENLSIEDRVYFETILKDSMLIGDFEYQQIKSQLDSITNTLVDELDFQIDLNQPNKHFLISSLPMTFDVSTLFRTIESWNSASECDINCAVHDLVLYSIDPRQTEAEIKVKLKHTFFQHPFIRTFIENVQENGQIFFGSAKQWIQQNCTNVPVPRRWEITQNIQILFRWIVELGDGKYVVDVPGAYSERLRLIR